MSSAAPFFIVGSARSGTTLLRLMLNAHPEVAVPPESRFITEFWDGHDEIEVDHFLARLGAHDRFAQWDLPIEAVRNELGDGKRVAYKTAVEAPFRAWARVHGKTRWGDKTPRYVERIPFLADLFPGSRFVHLVRDGRNVALSYADVPFGPKTVAKAAALWAERVCAGYTSGRSLERGRYLEIRYEDLVEDAEGEAKDLCDFLDIPFQADMLDYTEKARAVVLPSASELNPHVTEKPRSGVRSWEQEMSARDIEVFEAVAGDVLSELGYARRFPSPGPHARAAAALARAGVPIGRLRSSR